MSHSPLEAARTMIKEGHLGGAWILANTMLATYPGHKDALALIGEINEKRADGAPWDPPLDQKELALLYRKTVSDTTTREKDTEPAGVPAAAYV